MKRTPSTVIVDTHTLTDGTVELVGYIGFDTASQNDCELTAARALIGATSSVSHALRDALKVNIPTAHAPIAHYETRIIRTLWHHGEQYMSYCIGPVADIVKICDLTENEREALVAQSGRIGGEGNIAYGLSAGISTTPIQRALQYQSSLTFIGIAVFQPSIYPRTVGIIEQLQEQGSRIVYLSRDNSSIVNAVAHASHIRIGTIYEPSLSMHHPDMSAVCDIASKDYASYIARYPSDAYVVKHDMTELSS